MVITGTAVRVVNVKYSDDYTVYIGRANPRYGLSHSIWANAHRIGKECTREQAIERYRRDIEQKPWLLKRLVELRGQILGCWCAPRDGLTSADPVICHGQILAQLVEALSE